MVEVESGSQGRKLRFVIIGAGMAGVLAGIKCKERGEEFTIYEKGDKVGGTWRENHYPGLACDTPAHTYSYSFAHNPDWSSYFAPGPEIREYFQAMADRYGVSEHIVFNAEIAECRWQEGRWHIRTKDGRSDVADVIVAATGVLHHPKIADIPGLNSFAGPYFHSARWDHSVEIDGKKIGVIGTGSTGVQIVSALCKRAGKLVHFQRSPQWIMPSTNPPYSEAQRAAFRADPTLIDAERNAPEALARRARFTAAIIDKDSPELAEIEAIVAKNLQDSVADPALRAKLTPNYRAACKRMVFSGDYYRSVQESTVYIETGAIDHVEPSGIRMKDGTFHELDVIALATGFHADRFVRPMTVIGENGEDLSDFWSERPRAYFAVTVPHFPNFFLLNGPTGPVGNFSLTDIAERQWEYSDQLLNLVREGKAQAIAPSMEALLDYETRRKAAAMNTVFASGCSSWYLDSEGVPQVWPWSYPYFLDVMANPRFEDYQLIGAADDDGDDEKKSSAAG
ncbi:flavin-containing monooxygenase [Sphingobium tyrosinilyticum]|uniref:Flavin-containing monooxygenase n=1 Tax=Sphingobium tyrosinilyticum TaxID=2715436 RepID=A0ABV9F2D1_9SPHN